jgi:hypothetical protein
MKHRKPGRPVKPGTPVHPLLRISEGNREIHDRYTADERSEVYDRALTTIFPKIPTEKTQPILIRPLKTETDTICRVLIVGRYVRLFFPEKRDGFRDLVKSFRYGWDGCWEREFHDSIDIVDRAAEIANEILLGGFCIQLENETVKGRVISRSFTPEAFKSIKRSLAGLYKDWFVINWPKAEDCYSEVMKLTAARYADGSVYVPSEHFLEIEDFAEINEFVLSNAAIELATEARAARESAIIISPKRKARKAPKKNEPSSNQIPAYLRDDCDD